jgi:hypothetical protein
MSIPYRTLFMFLIIALAVVPGFSQDANTKKAETKTPVVTKEEPRSDGLRKITTRTSRDWDFDIHIDEEALEANIERAVEQAMKDLEISLEKLEKLEIHLEPIEINLQKLNLDMKPIDIHIPHLNIDIAPIMIDLDDMDIDIDEDFDHDVDVDFDADDDRDEDDDNFLHKNKNKENEELKNKSEEKEKLITEKANQKEKDKAKGLKKMN